MAAGTELLLAPPTLSEPLAISDWGLTFTQEGQPFPFVCRGTWGIWMWATHGLLTCALNTSPADRSCLERQRLCALLFLIWAFWSQTTPQPPAELPTMAFTPQAELWNLELFFCNTIISYPILILPYPNPTLSSPLPSPTTVLRCSKSSFSTCLSIHYMFLHIPLRDVLLAGS